MKDYLQGVFIGLLAIEWSALITSVCGNLSITLPQAITAGCIILALAYISRK